MLKDITLGQYFPGDTLAHKLDPRTKLLITVLYIVALFTAKSYLAYGILVLTLVIAVRICMCCPDTFDRYHYRTVPWRSGGRQDADYFVSNALMCVASAMNSAVHRGKFVSDDIA